MLLQQLTEAMRSMTQLESQLKVLSASTLSMSSSSSLGSLSSSHASSKGNGIFWFHEKNIVICCIFWFHDFFPIPIIGSLSSLSFTDIYGLSTTSEPSMVDLHKKILPPHQAMSSHQVGGVTTLKRIVIFIFKKFFSLSYFPSSSSLHNLRGRPHNKVCLHIVHLVLYLHR